MLTWSEFCIISNNDSATVFATTNPKLYVPVVVLEIQNKAKLRHQVMSGFKWIVNLDNYQSKKSTRTWNQYLDCWIDPSFQRAKRHFVWFIENNAHNIQVIDDTFLQLQK